jgi:hypothetical protein
MVTLVVPVVAATTSVSEEVSKAAANNPGAIDDLMSALRLPLPEGPAFALLAAQCQERRSRTLDSYAASRRDGRPSGKG